MDIAGKVALVTGASSGIGLATARLFAQHGARVALAARSADRLQQLAAELPDSLPIPTEMRDDASVRAMISTVDQHYGRLDILINNAGQGMYTTIVDTDIDQYRQLYELNVVSVLVAMQAATPLMRRQGGGVIINISSGTTKAILPFTGSYASTKHALNGITLTARAELASENIRVGLVYPFRTETNFQTNAVASGPQVTDRVRGMQGDSAEYVAGLILEAVQTEAAEVYAENVKRLAANNPPRPSA